MTALQTRLLAAAGFLLIVASATGFFFDTSIPLVWWPRFTLYLLAGLLALRVVLDGEANPRGEKKATRKPATKKGETPAAEGEKKPKRAPAKKPPAKKADEGGEETPPKPESE